MFLMGKPLSNLDAILCVKKKLGITMVHVTHDQAKALSIVDRMTVMNFLEDSGNGVVVGVRLELMVTSSKPFEE